jgi:hypothetical protein
MLFSISFSFTDKNVNHIVIFEPILMKLYQLTEDCGFLLYIRGRLIYQSRDFKKIQGRSTSLLIHPEIFWS